VRIIVLKSFLLIMFLTFAMSVTAWADSTTCTGDMTGSFESIVVPPGAYCGLYSANVNGNIAAYEGSQLFIGGGVTVIGNVSATSPQWFYIYTDPAAVANNIHGNVTVIGATGDLQNPFSGVAVYICGTIIGGNVRITDTINSIAFGGSEPGAACESNGGGNSVPAGNVRIEDNAGPFFRVADNTVAGNMRIIGNTGSATKRVLNNQIGLQLTCLYNDSPFVIGGNNAKKLIGQCRP
jgi:hypothetical protein